MLEMLIVRGDSAGKTSKWVANTVLLYQGASGVHETASSRSFEPFDPYFLSPLCVLIHS